MKPNQLARLAAVVLLLAGVAALLAAGLVAVRSFEARGLPQNPRRFDCGSVLFTKDPLTLVPRQANQPPLNIRRANANCEKLRSSRTPDHADALRVRGRGVVPS